MPKWDALPARAEDLKVSAEDMLDAARRKAVFRDIGRTIHAGNNVDTAATIGRALENAFRAGIETARHNPRFEPTTRGKPASSGRAQPSSSSNVIDKKSLSERAFNAFSTLSLKCVGHWIDDRDSMREHDPDPVILVRSYGIRSNELWIITGKEGDLFFGDTFGANTIAPLIKLGLMVQIPGHPDYLTVSGRGLEFMKQGRTATTTSVKPLWTFKEKAGPTS